MSSKDDKPKKSATGMKTYKWILVAIMVAASAIVGCSKKTSVNTAPMEQSFKSSEPAAQSASDKVVAAIKTEDYSGALTQLQTLAKNAKLTSEQQQAIKDVIAQVEKVLADTATKSGADATKAASDLQKSLPK